MAVSVQRPINRVAIADVCNEPRSILPIEILEFTLAIVIYTSCTDRTKLAQDWQINQTKKTKKKQSDHWTFVQRFIWSVSPLFNPDHLDFGISFLAY